MNLLTFFHILRYMNLQWCVIAYDNSLTYKQLRKLCNLRRETLEVVRDFPDHQPSYNVFNFELPCWPTPIHSSPFLLVKAAYLFCCLLAWVFKAF